ncbi:uncharacterized protein LOC127835150 isoform X2 [Dreissena polymorpha]|uniref:Uncharacterized protein n=2 Tax=Dreissena polymorpha TaxID=45954 RepID=A0A9D4FX26_DREPO|nr:uncharacterized protein LOC127835150 isoform X2 [Dreissena polymorpha]XP_052217416.1 uncharacterized protein LOC127835150 isoform X2 [Dreissena polymorpha]XP_052217417.1 uncharacterized protein LOC127835150 isoform X2 [Dreissena polymorpha]XP_052217418.1 uncharacterized protein LOC127835150 isoform X2 [Dreissena polymorpha]KAH3803507.1 hypothetical protein DPMN_131769 [Dreissena polymorpha]
MGPVLLYVLVLAMYHPAEIFLNQIRIAEYAISLLPSGSLIHIGFLGYEYVGLFDARKEEYENSSVPVLKLSNFESYAFYINASMATFNYKHNFNGPPGLSQIGLILGTESRVKGDLMGIKEFKKKTYVVVDTTSPTKSLAELATSPNHVFSPSTFDANRFSNLFYNDAQQVCDTDMYLPASGDGSCQLCMNACETMFALNCTTQDIQRQCKYNDNTRMIPDVSAKTSTPSYSEPIYVHDNRRLSRTITIELPIALLIIAVIVSLLLFYVVRPKVVRKWFQNVLALCFDCIASFLSPFSHKLFDDPSHVPLFDDFSDDEVAFA